MAITIDKAGRLVIPKPLRDRLGLAPGTPLSVTTEGTVLRIEVERQGGRVVEHDGRLLVVAASGRPVSDDELRDALDAIRR